MFRHWLISERHYSSTFHLLCALLLFAFRVFSFLLSFSLLTFALAHVRLLVYRLGSSQSLLPLWRTTVPGLTTRQPCQTTVMSVL